MYFGVRIFILWGVCVCNVVGDIIKFLWILYYVFFKLILDFKLGIIFYYNDY